MDIWKMRIVQSLLLVCCGASVFFGSQWIFGGSPSTDSRYESVKAPLPIEESQRAAEKANAIIATAFENESGNATGSSVKTTSDSQSTQPAGNPNTDWPQFEITDFDPATYIHSKKGRIDESLLYRNKTLNPYDLPIDSSQRSLLTVSLSPIIEGLRNASALKMKTIGAEFNHLVDSGQADTVKTSDPTLEGRLTAGDVKRLAATKLRIRKKIAKRRGVPLEEVGEEAVASLVVPDLMFKGHPKPKVFKTDGGVLYSATMRKLPGARSISEAELFLEVELLSSICTWFASVGAADLPLRDAQIQALMELPNN